MRDLGRKVLITKNEIEMRGMSIPYSGWHPNPSLSLNDRLWSQLVLNSVTYLSSEYRTRKRRRPVPNPLSSATDWVRCLVRISGRNLVSAVRSVAVTQSRHQKTSRRSCGFRMNTGWAPSCVRCEGVEEPLQMLSVTQESNVRAGDATEQ